jgi:ABC-2 type transport system permease protein
MSLQGELSKFMAADYKNWAASRRNIFTLFEVLFWPMIGLISIGLMTRYLEVGKGTLAFLFIGDIALTLLQVTQMDVAYVLLCEMWSKSMKNMFITPIRSYHLIFGSLIFGVARGIAVFGIMGLASYSLFGFNFLEGGIMPVIIFLAGSFAMGTVIGITVCIILLVSGIYYPIEVMPGPFQILARAIPFTYFLEYYRSFYVPGPYNLFTGTVLAVVYLIVGLVVLDWSVERARNTGILLRLSE